MDLILLQPGDADVFTGLPTATSGESLIEGSAWGASELKLGSCIELVSIHQGMKQQITTDLSNAARTSGRPVMTELTCVKYVDPTSVKLYDYCLRAKSLGSDKNNPTKIHILRRSSDQLENIMTFQLRDAIVSEIQFQSHPNDMPTEQFKLNFTEILWSYSVLHPDSGATDKLASGWSISRNRPIAQFTD